MLFSVVIAFSVRRRAVFVKQAIVARREQSCSNACLQQPATMSCSIINKQDTDAGKRKNILSKERTCSITCRGVVLLCAIHRHTRSDLLESLPLRLCIRVPSKQTADFVCCYRSAVNAGCPSEILLAEEICSRGGSEFHAHSKFQGSHGEDSFRIEADAQTLFARS